MRGVDARGKPAKHELTCTGISMRETSLKRRHRRSRIDTNIKSHMDSKKSAGGGSTHPIWKLGTPPRAAPTWSNMRSKTFCTHASNHRPCTDIALGYNSDRAQAGPRNAKPTQRGIAGRIAQHEGRAYAHSRGLWEWRGRKNPQNHPSQAFKTAHGKKTTSRRNIANQKQQDKNGLLFVTKIVGPAARYRSPFRRSSCDNTLRKLFSRREGVEDVTKLCVDNRREQSLRLEPHTDHIDAAQQKSLDELSCVRHRIAICGPRHCTYLQAPNPGPTQFGGSPYAILPARPGPRPPGAGMP